jgi:hypothetical protein
MLMRTDVISSRVQLFPLSHKLHLGATLVRGHKILLPGVKLKAHGVARWADQTIVRRTHHCFNIETYMQLSHNTSS